MADRLEIGESDFHCCHVGSIQIGMSVFFKQSFDAWCNLRESILRHGGEKMVFNLEVKVGHPPVDERSMADIHSVVRSIGDPVDVIIFSNGGQVGVRDCKVGENVSCANPDVKEVAQGSHSPSEIKMVKVSNCGISATNPKCFEPFFFSEDASWVKEHSPTSRDEKASHWEPK